MSLRNSLRNKVTVANYFDRKVISQYLEGILYLRKNNLGNGDPDVIWVDILGGYLLSSWEKCGHFKHSRLNVSER
jgi:hypothetical protein